MAGEGIVARYMPNWYTIAKDYTPETIFLDAGADLVNIWRNTD